MVKIKRVEDDLNDIEQCQLYVSEHIKNEVNLLEKEYYLYKHTAVLITI